MHWRDDRHLFEMLVLEGAQAGLSWSTILRKRAGYRGGFDDFDIDRVARYTPARVERMMANPAIVRNRAKIEGAVATARTLRAARDEFGSLDRYLWSFTGGRPIVNRWRTMKQVPATRAESDTMSKALKAAQLQVRRLDDLLRVHAGDRHGRRPRKQVLEAERGVKVPSPTVTSRTSR